MGPLTFMKSYLLLDIVTTKISRDILMKFKVQTMFKIFCQNSNATLKRIGPRCEYTAVAFKWLRIIMQIFFTCHIDPDVSCTST